MNKGKEKWKETARALFLFEGLTPSDIAPLVHRARETVSRYINTLPEYNAEMNRRRESKAASRRFYLQNYYETVTKRRCELCTQAKMDADALKRDHENAVRILSAERY